MLIDRLRIRVIRCSRTAEGRLSHVSIWASAAEYHAPEFISQPFGLFRIGGAAKAFGQVEELLLFSLLRLHAVLNEFYEHPICAETAGLCQRPNLGSNHGRQGNALTDRLVSCPHNTIMHQCDASPRRLSGTVFDQSGGTVAAAGIQMEPRSYWLGTCAACALDGRRTSDRSSPQHHEFPGTDTVLEVPITVEG